MTQPKLNWKYLLLSGHFMWFLLMVHAGVESHFARAGEAGALFDLWRSSAGAFLFGFLPMTLLLALSEVLARHIHSRRVGWFVACLTPCLAGALAMILAYASEVIGTEMLFPGLVAVVLMPMMLSRVLRDRAHPPFQLTPLTLGWLGAVVTLAAVVRATTDSYDTLALVAIVVAVTSPVFTIGYDALSRWWPGRRGGRRIRVLSAALLLGGFAALVGADIFQQRQLMGLYLPLKTCVFLSGALFFWVVCAPGLREISTRPTRWLKLSWAIPALSLAAVLGMLVLPISGRFGPHRSDTMVGLCARTLSQWADADGDGFYAMSVGGNDCDDSDPTITPATPEPAKNCWVREQPDNASHTRAPQQAEPTDNSLTPPIQNAIVFVSDALRPELLTDPKHLERFPNFRQLAEESTRFESAYAPSNATLMSLVTMHSGIMPATLIHSVISNRPAPLADLLGPSWIFEVNPQEFCRVMIVQGHAYADWLTRYYPAELDVKRYDFALTATGHSSPRALQNTREALDQCAGRRLLMTIYVDDPHIEQPEMRYTCRDGSRGGFRCYLEEVEIVDESVGKLLDLLGERQILQDSIFILTADHGEAFGEHGHTTHASSVYNTQIHVPLLVRMPGNSPGHVTTPVSLMGLKATIAEATGAPIPHPLPYPSWLELLDDPSAPYPAPISESLLGLIRPAWGSPTSAIIDGNWKLIYDWKTTRLQLFDLDKDPGEHHNLADSQPGRARRLVEKFKRERSRLIMSQGSGYKIRPSF